MFPFGFLASGCLGHDGGERFREAWAQLLVFSDLQPRVERLVRQSPAPVVGVGVGVVRVGEEPQAVVEEGPTAGVLFVVLGEAVLDVGQPSADAVLVPLECREVDRVGEVRCDQLVALRF
ncbi:hypothetical protein [Pseudoclavibacter chungangensis]|uniref:hypothetical protein n=1 Tax=Pseudoclavibacter chungangensis TaxID=587635 RepID=UPI001CE4A32D|nr:hypothetical protein [Pseudoclavibacter chungangensis]